MTYTAKDIQKILSKIEYQPEKADIISLKMVEELCVEGNKVSFLLVFNKADRDANVATKNACLEELKKYLGADAEIDINVNLRLKRGKTQSKSDKMPTVKNIIAIASGKGGVGKSTVSANLAVALAKNGAKVGLIDADIFGPSIPKMFNVENAHPEVEGEGDNAKIIPITQYGVKMLSIGFFVSSSDATIWRGPMAGNALMQMISQGKWGDLDYLLIDLPPGTSDIHLTLVQNLAITGAVIVSTPQAVALADVVKGISMFRSQHINVPVLGLIENMSWFTPEELPENKYYIFGKEGCKNLANKLDIPFLGEIPIVQSIREDGDIGKPSALKTESPIGVAFDELAKNLIAKVQERNTTLPPTKKVLITK